MKRVLSILIVSAFFMGVSVQCAPAVHPSPVLPPYGLFVHYGLYSLAGGVWNGKQIPYYAEQIMNHARITPSDYEKLAQQFTAEKFNADSIVQLAQDAGMQYVLFTAKHHDGFCLFNSPSSKGYNSVEATPSHRDLVKELAEACARRQMKLGLYYSLPDWHYPYSRPIERPANDTTTNCTQFVNQVYSPLELISDSLENYIVAQLQELLTQYGPICTLWFDMGLPTPVQSERFRATVKALQPDCLVGGRVGNGCGDYLTLPDNAQVAGGLWDDAFSLSMAGKAVVAPSFMWDSPASLYGTWGYRSWQERIPVAQQVKRQLARFMQTRSHGGTFVLNIGPAGDGSILPYENEILTAMGSWVKAHNAATLGARPTPFSQLPAGISCTHLPNADLNGGTLYLTVFDNYPIERLFITATHLKSLLIRNGLRNTITLADVPTSAKTPYVARFEYADTLCVKQPGTSPLADSSLVLTQANGHALSAFDTRLYNSCEPNAKWLWYLYGVPEGDYAATIAYTPEATSQTYRLGSLTTLLPGVDRMHQTFYAGILHLTPDADGNAALFLEPVSEDPLQPLNLKDITIYLTLL